MHYSRASILAEKAMPLQGFAVLVPAGVQYAGSNVVSTISWHRRTPLLLLESTVTK